MHTPSRPPVVAPGKSCRVAGGHAASLAGEVSKGGGSKVDASRSVDGYLGVGEFSGNLEAATGFACDSVVWPNL